jgi:hypothetical protein
MMTNVTMRGVINNIFLVYIFLWIQTSLYTFGCPLNFMLFTALIFYFDDLINVHFFIYLMSHGIMFFNKKKNKTFIYKNWCIENCSLFSINLFLTQFNVLQMRQKWQFLSFLLLNLMQLKLNKCETHTFFSIFF